MVARAQLAVLDFNCGVGIEQSKNKHGELRFKHQFSKVTQSWVVKKIPEKKEKTLYLSHIMDEISYLQKTGVTYETPKLDNVPRFIGGVEKPDKLTTISNLKSRFKVKE